MKTIDELIYDLIFSENTIYKIDLADYLVDIYLYEDFVDEIKMVLKKSKVNILKSSIMVNSKTVIWELKVKK